MPSWWLVDNEDTAATDAAHDTLCKWSGAFIQQLVTDKTLTYGEMFDRLTALKGLLGDFQGELQKLYAAETNFSIPDTHLDLLSFYPAGHAELNYISKIKDQVMTLEDRKRLAEQLVQFMTLNECDSVPKPRWPVRRGKVLLPSIIGLVVLVLLGVYVVPMILNASWPDLNVQTESPAQNDESSGEEVEQSQPDGAVPALTSTTESSAPVDNSPAQCGNGVCDTGVENTDLCPQDCMCVDDGVCAAGEGFNCADCGDSAGTCGNSCQDGAQCAAGLTCASGICWDACICGGDCNGGSGGDSDSSGPVCGNGVVEAGEQCDGSGDPCSTGTCIQSVCQCLPG